MPMVVHKVDPLRDSRWAEMLARHPNASIFHSVPWLEALRRTYGYIPSVLTTSGPGEPLQNGIVFSEVRSWITGRRLVSLPFSDHCELLWDQPEAANSLLRYLATERERGQWSYVEIRSRDQQFGDLSAGTDFRKTNTYFLHEIDLNPSADKIFRSFHKSSIQRRIRHAELVGLQEVSGNGDELVEVFYGLFVQTRRRHKLPPQPRVWFRNLRDSLGDALTVRVAYKDGMAVAAILTLRFKDIVYYKYGASDTQFHKLGAGPWLMWRAIRDAKETGASRFDLGRSEETHAGLVKYKSHWTEQTTQLTYWRCVGRWYPTRAEHRTLNLGKHVFAHTPQPMLTLFGEFFYKHIG